MKIHNINMAAVILFLLLLLTACGADKPKNSVTVMGTVNDKEIAYEVEITSDSIALWHTEGLKAYSSSIALPYNVESPAYSMSNIKTADIDLNGCFDIIYPYKNADGSVYSYVIFTYDTNSFALSEPFSELPNLSFDEQNIISETDTGLFGIRRSVYKLGENGNLTPYGTYITNTFDVIRAFCRAFYGRSDFRIERPEENAVLGIVYGRVNINGVYCTVYTVSDDEGIKSVFAVSDDGKWFLDDGAVSLYREITDADGKPVLGNGLLTSSGIPYGALTFSSYLSMNETDRLAVCIFVTDYWKRFTESAPGGETLFNSVASLGETEIDPGTVFFYLACDLCGVDRALFASN